MNRQETVDALKSAAKNIGTAGVMAYLITVAPWTRIPVLKAIVEWIVKYVLGLAIDKTEIGAFFLFIDVRSSLQGRAFAEAALRNREVQKNGTPEQKAQAEAEVISRFRTLVKYSS